MIIVKVNRKGCQKVICRAQTREPSLPRTPFLPNMQSTQPRSPVKGQSGAGVLPPHLKSSCQRDARLPVADARSQILS